MYAKLCKSVILELFAIYILNNSIIAIHLLLATPANNILNIIKVQSRDISVLKKFFLSDSWLKQSMVAADLGTTLLQITLELNTKKKKHYNFSFAGN